MLSPNTQSGQRMVQKGWNENFCESLEDENVDPFLRDLYNENTAKGIRWRVFVG